MKKSITVLLCLLLALTLSLIHIWLQIRVLRSW